MFPNRVFPQNGNFIFNQVVSLKKYFPDKISKLTVISPVPKSFSLLSRWNNRWKLYYEIPFSDYLKKWGINIVYPRYMVMPSKIVPIVKGWFFGFEPYTMAISLKSLKIIHDNFNLIYAHTAIPDCLAAVLLKPYHKHPVLCHFRGSDIHTYPYYNRLAFNAVKKAIIGADKIICVSEYLKNQVYKIASPKRAVEVIYNGVDTIKFRKRLDVRKQLRKRLGFSKSDKVLLFIGALIREKGIFELLEAFGKLMKMESKYKLLIVGDGDERSAVLKYIERYKLKPDVLFLGAVSHDKIPEIMNVADVFVFPSHVEGLPNVVLEALASELPVVTTSVGGIPEVIRSGYNGILIPPKNIEALVKSVTYLVKNLSLAKLIGQNGRNIVSDKFTWKKSAESLIRVYEKLSY